MTEDPYALLQEWFDFWAQSEDVPNKMPNSLHTRTQVALTEYRFRVKEQKLKTEAHAWPSAKDTEDAG